MAHPDQKYVDALIKNDPVLIEELYRKFSGKIKWMILKSNGTETDACDIFQDALLSIYRNAKTKNFILTCPLDAFLYRICKNKWISELSRRKHGKVTILDNERYNDIGEEAFKLAEDCRIQDERKTLLSEKLEELGDSCRQLLHLSWSGKTMEEVADLLQITYGYARKKKSECMAKLIELVKQSSKFDALKW